MALSPEITMSVFNVGCTGLYASGNQRTRRSPVLPRISLNQPSSCNYNNGSGERGARSYATYAGQPLKSMDTTGGSGSVVIQGVNVARCEVCNLKSRWNFFTDLATQHRNHYQ